MKKLFISFSLLLGAFILLSNAPLSDQSLDSDVCDPPPCNLTNVRAWVVDNIPNYSGPAYFASEETALVFIGLFGGGEITETSACKPYDQVIRQTCDPCTPCGS